MQSANSECFIAHILNSLPLVSTCEANCLSSLPLVSTNGKYQLEYPNISLGYSKFPEFIAFGFNQWQNIKPSDPNKAL